MSTQSSNLAKGKCSPCAGNVRPLSEEDRSRLAAELPEWQVVDNHHLTRKYTFKNFTTTLDFVNRVAAVAESEGHHPNITFTWGKAQIDIWKHKVDGLTENDFILAAKFDAMPAPSAS
ncbi:MAG: 4a-hydroxytetrahydrobiopterin dehydratase [Bdellovibrionota bacterium]